MAVAVDGSKQTYLLACCSLQVLGNRVTFWDHISISQGGSIRIKAMQVFGGRMEDGVVLRNKLVSNLQRERQGSEPGRVEKRGSI
jgi:hypothetical protein